MSSKSKKRPPKWSKTAQMNSDLLIFFWALVTKGGLDIETMQAVMGEVINVTQSVKAGLVSLDMINKQLISEYGIHTDWARRDRG